MEGRGRKPEPAAQAEDEATIDIEDLLISFRLRMVAFLESSGGITDKAVLQAMRIVPRDKFVPVPVLYQQLYQPLHVVPILPDRGVSLSEPNLMASMLQHLQVGGGQRVLEIGTGMGYNAALLSQLVGNEGSVFTIERLPEIADLARQTLAEIGCQNVTVVTGNGHEGVPEQAPFDRIIATAAAAELPPALYDQLAVGGRMIIPLGLPRQTQGLFLVEKGEIPRIASLGSVDFYPMVNETTTPPQES